MISAQSEKVTKGRLRKIIKMIGDDPDRPGLVNTPERVLRMWKEIFKGYDKETYPKVSTFYEPDSSGLVVDKGYFYSTCEHHMLPFFGEYAFGYIPYNGLVIGASKIARIVDWHSSRLQIAERLCKEILIDIDRKINPLGSILLMCGRHLCKEMRGVKQHNSSFEILEAFGVLFENDKGCKDEFLARIGVKL